MKQRVMALALGYEDLNDHDELRWDSVLALLSDCPDVLPRFFSLVFSFGGDPNQSKLMVQKLSLQMFLLYLIP